MSTDSSNLPSLVRPERNRMPRQEEIPQPGSWWKITPFDLPEPASQEDLALKKISDSMFAAKWDIGQRLPDHGLVLLLVDTRYIDGELHSLILAPHPGWSYGRNIALSIADFDRLARYEPDGQMLRDSEKAATMAYMQRLQRTVGEPPDSDDVSRRVQERLDEEDRKTEARKGAGLSLPAPESSQDDPSFESYSRMVPAALLPSQDLIAAERTLKRHIATAEVTREIIEHRISEAGKAMGVVSRYQEEVVSTALAGISKQQKEANKLLTSVHTMKLWLGDGIDIHPMTKGQGASPDEPVHFMQSLLYLDEEIHCAEVIEGGFTADDLVNLPTFLERNSAIVETMLPHQRCVAIARIRRSQRDFEAPKSISDLLHLAESIKADQTILIFVRDGENISIIETDGETSGAKRLFPSRAEIEAIFRERSHLRGDQERIIDVSDVRYADKRAEHDKVALFYKRFLLILWGAHERSEIFGSLPKGLNWLQGKTHDRYFRFIHDEEFGLDDKSSLSIQDWIMGHLKTMRPGSRAVLNWNTLISPDSAPGAFNNPEHHTQEQIRTPISPREITVIQESDGALFATCPCEKPYDWKSAGKIYNINVQIAIHAGHPEKHKDDYHGFKKGIFVLDHMKSMDIESYLGSRKARRSYLSWMPEIQIALPEIRKREAMEAALHQRILANHPEARTIDEEILKRSIHEAVLAAGWEIPEIGMDPGILRQAERSTNLPEFFTDAEYLAVRSGGSVLRASPARPLFEGLIEEPFVIQEVLEEGRSGFRVKSSKEVPYWMVSRPGDLVVHEMEKPEFKAFSSVFRIKTVQDKSWMQKILSSGEEYHDLVDGLLNPTEELVESWVSRMIRINRDSKGRSVIKMPDAPVIGFAVIPPRNLGNETQDRFHSLRAIRLGMDLVQHAYTAGFHEEALRFGMIHADPSRLKRRLEENRDEPALTVFLDVPRAGKAWRSLDQDGVKGGTPAGFRTLEVKDWYGKSSYEHKFESPDLKTALLRPILENRCGRMLSMKKAYPSEWIETQKDIRVFMAEGIEEKLLNIMSIYESIPERSAENRFEP